MDISIRDTMYGVSFHRSNGSEKLIVCIGDSWTAGDGIYSKADLANLKCTKLDYFRKLNSHNYPFYLQKHIPMYDILNLGYLGGSNEISIEALYKNLDIIRDYSEVIILFGITSPARNLFFFDDMPVNISLHHLYDEEVKRTKHAHNDLQCEFIKYYLTEVQSDGYDKMRLFHLLYNLQTFCELNKYKLLCFSAFSHISFDPSENESTKHYTELINHDNIVTEYTIETDVPCMADYLLKYAEKNKMTRNMIFNRDCGHCNASGYHIMANELINQLKLRSYI